jgi:cell division protein FtsX
MKTRKTAAIITIMTITIAATIAVVSLLFVEVVVEVDGGVKVEVELVEVDDEDVVVDEVEDWLEVV